jgi:hypothetical protein
VKKNPPSSTRLIARIGLVLALVLNSAAAFAGDAREIALTGVSPNHRASLVGTKMRTIYEEQQYESTCYREVAYTEYRQSCDYRTVRHCSRVGGGRQCVPSCREVVRQVCNSSGCRNVSTRECTQSCQTVPGREVCSDRREAYNCRNIPYIAYRSIPYSCMKSRTVAVGTELDEQISADVTVRVVGDARSLSGKDVIKLSVADGTDVSRSDLLVEMKNSADTHFLAVKKSEEKASVGERQSHIVAEIEIEAIPYSSILGHKTSIVDLDANRGSVSVVTAGDAIDDSVVLHIVAKNDRVLGGMKKDFDRTLVASQLAVSNVGGNQKVVASLGKCLNSRPHEFEVTLTRDASKLLGVEILNGSAVEKAKKDLAAKATKRLKMKGERGTCSADDSQN